MSRGWMAFFAGVLLAPLLIAYAGRRPEGSWTPAGYVRHADELVRDGHLVLHCQTPGASDGDTITPDFTPGSVEERWYFESYLSDDVRRFNTDPSARPGPFLIDGCRMLGVDPFFHRINLPGTPTPSWRGDVLLSGPRASATLEGLSNAQALEVRHPLGLPDSRRSAAVSPADSGRTESTALLHIRAPGKQDYTASFFMTGGSLVMADNENVGDSAAIRVQGYEVLQGRVVRVEPGDWLRFSFPWPGAAAQAPNRSPWRSFTYLVNAGEGARVASFVRVQNRQVERVYPVSYLQPLLAPFSEAMDLVLQSSPNARRATGYGVQLSLEHAMGDSLQRRLRSWCARHPLAGRPRAVSALVMDAFQGGVRAMPSCPEARDLAPFEPLGNRQRDRLARNQNLVPHAIGSAGKPFWAAAVASTYPNFLDLEVPGHGKGPVSSILGCPVAEYRDHAHGSPGGWVGLEQFIRESCNRYVVDFATAALTVLPDGYRTPCRQPVAAGAVAGCFPPAGPGTAPNLRFCDQLIATVLAPSPFVVSGNCGSLQLLGRDFLPAPRFRAITNVKYHWEDQSTDTISPAEDVPSLADQYRLKRFRVDVWRRVFDAFDPSTAFRTEMGLRFTDASPEAANLALNTVDKLREDWANLLLGGENARWSNFQLSEALARLMTGRQLVGSFADSILPAGRVPARLNAREQFAPIPPELLHPGVRRRVLHAMELVAGNGGTAARLQPSVAALANRLRTADPLHPYDLYVFAKTGTPNIPRFVPAGLDAAVSQMYWQGGLRWSTAQQRFTWTPAGKRIMDGLPAGVRASLVADVLEPMRQDPPTYQSTPGQPPPDHPLYFTPSFDLVFRGVRGRELPRQGGVLVLGLLAVPSSIGRAAAAQSGDWISACPVNPGLRQSILEIPPVGNLDPRTSVGVSIALFVDDLPEGQGSGLAVDLARELFPLLADDLTEQIMRRTH